MATRRICPSCTREVREPDPTQCPYCGLSFDEGELGETAEAMIVGDLDDDGVLDAPTFIPGAVKSYLFYGSGQWKQNVRAILESPSTTEPVYPSEMTADDLGAGVDPESLYPAEKEEKEEERPPIQDAIEGDTLRIEIPEKKPSPPPPAPAPPRPPPPPEMDVRARKLYEQAEVEKARGDFVAAHRNVKLALTFDPKNGALKKLLSELSRGLPKDRKSAPVVSPAQSLADRAAEKERAGDVDGAIELLERALKTQKKDPALYNRLGVILAIRKKNFERGREMVEKALELSPNNETYRHNLSKILTHAATRELERGRDSKSSGGAGGGIFGIFGKKK